MVVAISCGISAVALNMSASQSGAYVNHAFIDLVNSRCPCVVLPPSSKAEQASAVVEKIDGLILSSGRDISPTLYGAEERITYTASGVGGPYVRPAFIAPDRVRDSYEIALYIAARRRGIPVLGICRGLQIINVAEGGTLHQEVDQSQLDHFVKPDGWIPYHTISVSANSRLRSIIGVHSAVVSSVHHQAIAELGAGLSVSARAEDGCVEAIEASDGSFVFGVQSHIELTMKNSREFGLLVDAFLSEAMVRQRTGSRES